MTDALPLMPAEDLVDVACEDYDVYMDGDDPGYAGGYMKDGILVLEYDPDESEDARYAKTVRYFREVPAL